MSTGPLGRIPVNQLSDRYKLARSVIYKRLKDLGIEREKIGNRAYLNREQLILFDTLHEFIQGGGTTAEFLFHRDIDPDDFQ